MIRKVSINNNSVEGAGLTSDYKQAICEYIWNGFDAHANKISINYSADELGNIRFLSIKDNGDGIDFNNLDDTFGAFLDSIKNEKSYQRSSNIKGKKGKGRYSFKCFANKVIWNTIFKHDDKFIEYDITILNSDKDQFEESDEKKISRLKETGTTVYFDQFHDFYSAYLESSDFYDYLIQQFSWFLFLNRERNFCIEINDKILDYKHIIADSFNEKIEIKRFDTTSLFEITYIRWKVKISEKYYFYFLNSEDFENTKIPTSFNHRDNGFHHSIYVKSPYFDDFIYDYKNKHGNLSIALFGKDQTNPVFKDLLQRLKQILSEKEKFFVREISAEKLIAQYINSGVIENNKKNEYDKIKQADLVSTIKEIYCIQPKIFSNLRKEQQKTIVGFLDLLLDSEERENVITILDGIVRMTNDERKSLAKVLKVTELSKITSLIKMLEDRYRVYYALKEAINNTELGIKEVPDLQQMIENSFWIFGEQYNIVTAAEPDFEEALKRFRYLLTGENIKTKIVHEDKNKEMDIFAVRQNPLVGTIENIVIELKHPDLLLGEKEVSQVKKYMRVILSEGEFNASNMCWSFFLIGKRFDTSNYIEGEVATNTHHGEPYLIFKNTQNITYKIYVKKWSEVFNDFELRHKFLVNKLDFRRQLLLAKATDKKQLHEIVKQA
jgi:hypothetical protein